MSTNVVRVQKEQLQDFVYRIFISSGLDENQSHVIARHLVLANLRGVDSHGVSRVAIYTKRLDLDLTNKQCDLLTVRESAASALLDARNCSGIAAATKGIELAVRKAKESGIGVVGIYHSNHCGMLADYTMYAAANDCIALAMTNARANMAPWGGRERFFGTNPISYGIPAGEETDIVFDMATSVVARGKIINAQKNQQSIPVGWAITKEGKPTSDATEALEGLVLPVGGHKGSGIAMLVDILSGLFTGARYGPHISDLYNNFEEHQNVGQFFMVMRADLFQPLEQFKARVDGMIREIRQVPLVEGVEKIYLPGEMEQEVMAERLRDGVPLSAQVYDELAQVSRRYDLPQSLDVI
ncbi:Ldh family oxidoreductase [Paenibacillus xerothermodurans]|uniref:Ldh family oxidoreductase n=1 Tax=Paenibacillus xerothermodurans TaxID=1977292 RepID=A0A2W1NB94_PAEXE|nr:Ldh family oxidoreductase [Paenibacillus xerothermodurans]PZE21687.1 Ldh family oxidoreductase [Paenibacillus xerothermodurans]